MSKKITKDLVKKIAGLAKLRLTEEQIEKYFQSLSSVVGYMDEMRDLKLDHIKETSRVNEEINILREDVVVDSMSQKDALKNAKNTHNGYFVVPFVFEEK